MYARTGDGSPLRVVWPRSVSAKNAYGIAQVGQVPSMAYMRETDGLEVSGVDSRGGLVVVLQQQRVASSAALALGRFDTWRSQGGVGRP
jgi:hypothetical protein